MLNVDRYFQRIDYSGPTAPTLETLSALHQAHLLAVPFENLDIHLGRAIVLDEVALYNKIVERRRGGFCYELNGLFAALLRALGFRVALLSAGVAHAAGGFGPEFDHLLLAVDLQERWLADVGFGDSFLRPLRLASGEQLQGGRVYRVDWNAEHCILLRQQAGTGEEAMYRFTLEPHELTDFTGMCRYQQSSPQSHFTQQRVCTRMTPRGQVTLSDTRLIVTTDGQREEQPITDEQAYTAVLRKYFDIDLTR
jgi:N-hydroxyarylamine O-acetyltransferase